MLTSCNNQARAKLNDQVWRFRAYFGVQPRIWTRVTASVWAQLNDQVWAQVHNQVCKQALTEIRIPKC